MITIVPHDAVIECAGGFGVSPAREGDWWAIYQWFCDRLTQWKHRDGNYDILNGRSKSGCTSSEFDPLCDRDAPIRRLGYLFSWVGTNWIEREEFHGRPGRESRFLSWMKLRKWPDLAKPISIHGRRPKVFPQPEWFEMRGRTLIKSPNEYHPKATIVFGFHLKPVERKGGVRWLGRIEYGYPHGSSSWYIRIPQLRREPLDAFAARIQKTIDGLLVPEPWSHSRKCYEHAWERHHNALDVLFCDDTHSKGGAIHLLADRLAKSDDRIWLNDERFTALRSWIAADTRTRRRAETKRQSQRERNNP